MAPSPGRDGGGRRHHADVVTSGCYRDHHRSSSKHQAVELAPNGLGSHTLHQLGAVYENYAFLTSTRSRII